MYFLLISYHIMQIYASKYPITNEADFNTNLAYLGKKVLLENIGLNVRGGRKQTAFVHFSSWKDLPFLAICTKYCLLNVQYMFNIV